MDKQIILTNIKGLTPKHKAEHEPFEYIKHEVTPRSDENQCYVCIYEIPQGKAGYPYHYHLANTEVFYIISGNGVIQTPDGVKPVAAGDVIVCPPGENGAHKIINTSQTERLTYLDCDTANSPDAVYYPVSGKVGVIRHGKPSAFFKEASAVDYYQGE